MKRRHAPTLAKTAAWRLARRPYDAGRALRRWDLIQAHPIALIAFREELHKRDLPRFDPFDDGALEVLDREDVLRPVGYGLHGFAWDHELESYLRDGSLLLRDETGFIPWRVLRSRARAQFASQLHVRYHPWQLIWAGELIDYLAAGQPVNSLAGGLAGYFEARARWAAAPSPTPDQVRAAAAGARRLEALLLRVSNVFYPTVLGGHYRDGRIAGVTDDIFGWTHQLRQDFDARAHARALGTDADDLAAIYDDLVVRAHAIDPNRQLFVLLDGLRRQPREDLRGKARRAWDYYYAARVIRHWHHRLTGEWLPDVDEAFDAHLGHWKSKLFGSKRPAIDRSALPAMLDHYGLYPYRVELLGEGDSELAALEEIVSYGYGLSFERLGVLTTDLRGSNVPDAARQLFGSLRRYANYFLVVMDNEGTARAMVDELERSGLIEGIPDERRREAIADAVGAVREQVFASEEERRAALRRSREAGDHLDHQPGEAPEHVLWQDNLEADNFTRTELCQVVNDLVGQEGIIDWTISEEMLDEALAAQGEGRAIASVLVDLAESQDPPARLTKPQLARALGRFAVDHPRLDDRERPILELAGHLVRLTGASRRARGQLRRR